MPTKQHILHEIRRVGKKINRPPGRLVFEKETGIRMSEWYGVYWRSWGDALAEAGFVPNQKQQKLSADDVLRHYAEAVRHFGRIPAEIDIRMYSRERKDFPGHTTFSNHFSNKAGLVTALSQWVHEQEDFQDLIKLVPEIEQPQEPTERLQEGFVYLLKSGTHYKIGRSEQIEQRVKQISVALPDTVTLVHTIRTDDPSGIEAYWHRRFANRRCSDPR